MPKLTDYQASLLMLAFIVAVLGGLGLMVALGHVVEQTSFGLQVILGGISGIGIAVIAKMPAPPPAMPDPPEEGTITTTSSTSATISKEPIP